MAANYKNIRNLSRRGKGSKAQKTKRERPEYEYELKVTRVLDGKYGVLFDLEINHVTIYGCRLCETREGVPFIGFPQQRDKKNKDRWWSVAYAPLTQKQTDEIIDQISQQLQDDDEAGEEEEADD